MPVYAANTRLWYDMTYRIKCWLRQLISGPNKHTIYKQEAHGPHPSPEKTVQINNHISLDHNVVYEKK